MYFINAANFALNGPRYNGLSATVDKINGNFLPKWRIQRTFALSTRTDNILYHAGVLSKNFKLRLATLVPI